MVKRIILAILLLPAAEIAAFVLVATLIGLAGALLLMLATTFAGILVLRQAGRGGMARFRVAVADGEMTATELNGAGVLTVLGGLLLVLGLFARPAAFLSSGLMAAAYFIGHAGGVVGEESQAGEATADEGHPPAPRGVVGRTEHGKQAGRDEARDDAQRDELQEVAGPAPLAAIPTPGGSLG